MALPRFAAKRDQSEQPIADTLKNLGWRVKRISAKGLPDLLAFHPAIECLSLIECKTGKKGLTKDQQQLLEEGWPFAILRTVDEAVSFHRNKVGRHTRAIAR